MVTVKRTSRIISEGVSNQQMLTTCTISKRDRSESRKDAARLHPTAAIAVKTRYKNSWTPRIKSRGSQLWRRLLILTKIKRASKDKSSRRRPCLTRQLLVMVTCRFKSSARSKISTQALRSSARKRVRGPSEQKKIWSLRLIWRNKFRLTLPN